MIADEIPQALKANPVDAAGISDGGIDGPAGQVFSADIADGAIAFVGQAKESKRWWQAAQKGFARCWASIWRMGRSVFDSSLGSSGTTGGGGGTRIP